MNGTSDVASSLEDAPRVGQDELAIVARVQRPDPRVEDLDRIDAGFDLRGEVVADHVGEPFTEAVPRGGVPYISALVWAKLFE